jgi:2-methylisocitrate lyase-like PEP mutase family enzyme
MSSRKQFRRLLETEGAVLAPVVHDALTARVVNEVGEFELVGISGYGVSLSSLGLPDAGYLTLDDALHVARSVSAISDAPVFADADTGFGNALNVRRTTREFVRNTDVAGFFIEDQVSPKRCGHVAGKRVLPIEEALGKIRAAADVRDEHDSEFDLIARTDARGAAGGSLDEAIERGNAYHDAGADVIFVEGPTSVEEVRRIGEEVDAPLKYNQTGVSPFVDTDELGDMGYDFASVTTTRAAIVNLYDHLGRLATDGVDFEAGFREDIADHPVGDLHDFSGFDEVRELEERYLPSAEVTERYAGSTGYGETNSVQAGDGETDDEETGDGGG